MYCLLCIEKILIFVKTIQFFSPDMTFLCLIPLALSFLLVRGYQFYRATLKIFYHFGFNFFAILLT